MEFGTRSVVNQRMPNHYYSVDGRSIKQPQHGLNILRMSDGTVKKVMVNRSHYIVKSKEGWH